MNSRIIVGDCLVSLRRMTADSVDCCVTSPPYYGLRDYGHAGQVGLESSPEKYVAKLVEVFDEVRRVLRPEGTLWLNLGDSYGTGKQLVGIPWRVAFALQSSGWVLRQDIVWHKPNPMPESVRDRCTKAHEYIFLFSRSEKYRFSTQEFREQAVSQGKPRVFGAKDQVGTMRQDIGRVYEDTGYRNKRSVWTVPVKPFAGAHFATFPPELIEPCILAGSPADGVVLDPFGGAGTTGLTATRHGRRFILCELNPDYARLAADRIRGDSPMFSGFSLEEAA